MRDAAAAARRAELTTAPARHDLIRASLRALAHAPDHEPTKIAYTHLTDPNGTALGGLVDDVLAKRFTAAAAVADFIAFVAECLKARAGAQRP